jgi:hypothetical protein
MLVAVAHAHHNRPLHPRTRDWLALDSGRLTGSPAVIRLGRRNEDLPPENLLIKWRRHAGCGFNVSTLCLLLQLRSCSVNPTIILRLTQVRHRMVEKTANPFRISSGNSRVYTTFAIELKTLGSSRPSCALSRLSRDSSVARTSRADHVIPLIPFQDGWSTLHAVLACPDCKHDTCFAAELKIFAIPRFYDELGLMMGWNGRRPATNGQRRS